MPCVACGRAEVSRNRRSVRYVSGSGVKVAGALHGADDAWRPAMKRRNSSQRGEVMNEHESHLSDRELIMAMDGELRPREAHRAEAHLEACWTCRSRKTELERAIADFVHLRQEFRLPKADGSRTMLKARLADAARSHPPPGWQVAVARKLRWPAAATACALLMIWTVT